ncbi:MAG TPA: sialidase family protein [Actinomycetota bacterium]
MLCLLAALALAGAACTTEPGPTRPRGPDAIADDGLAEELEEQEERTDSRLEALQEAIAAGSLGRIEPIRRAAAPGWAGSVLLNDTGDDWEPAVAADPNGPYLYVLHNRYGGDPACRNGCPDPAMILHVSKNGGRTFGRERYLCRCKGVEGQHDPLIEVVPQTGDVYAVWMNNFQIHFSRSANHGRTWTRPVHVHPNVRWGDKPILATSADGRDVYVAFNGPSAGDSLVSASHDGGATWTHARTSRSERYYFAYGGQVVPDGAVVFTEISFSYTGPGGDAEGPIQIHAIRSSDGGTTWTDTIVDELELGPPCTSRGCYRDFHDSGPALAADEDGDLVVVYNGASRPGGPRTVYARSSTDGGQTWSPRTRLSRRRVNAAFPTAVGTGDDEVRVCFMDQRTGRWNARYRTSRNLGGSWSKAVRISDARSGTAYKDRTGFLEVYGDYGEIAVTNRGRTVAVWGEGSSYFGPGGIWLNREM